MRFYGVPSCCMLVLTRDLVSSHFVQAVWFGCDVDQHFDGKEGLSDLEL